MIPWWYWIGPGVAGAVGLFLVWLLQDERGWWE